MLFQYGLLSSPLSHVWKGSDPLRYVCTYVRHGYCGVLQHSTARACLVGAANVSPKRLEKVLQSNVPTVYLEGHTKSVLLMRCTYSTS